MVNSIDKDNLNKGEIEKIEKLWGYVSPNEMSTGYEDVIDEISSVTSEEFNKLDEDGKDSVIEHIFSVLRRKNIFPIYYFNESGIYKEINKCLSKNVAINGNVLAERGTQGQHLCRFIFKNLHSVDCKGAVGNNMLDRFYDDHKLKKTIRFVLTYEDIKNTYSAFYRPAQLIGGGVATNFSPMRAKAIYEKYVPNGGIIYDYSCGFGGRMLGALTSKNNYKYFGVEPNLETYDGLNILGEYIQKATKREDIFKVYPKGSEKFRLSQGEYYDFAFSSPPYFNLEKYSDDNSQCYIMFDDIDSWFDGYVIPTIQNIFYMLKRDSYYAVNIADFFLGKQKISFVDRWIEESINAGFKYHETIELKLQRRRGAGHKADDGADKPKAEGIFVFKKP